MGNDLIYRCDCNLYSELAGTEEMIRDLMDEYGLTWEKNIEDNNFDEDKIKSSWNYINKIWNASRFVLMNIEDLKEIKLDNLSKEDKWILTKYEKLVESTIKHMDKYEFNLVGSETYNFIYDDFCSNYIEFAKFNLDSISTKSVLCYVLTGILKLLHPFMPFVTEEIYSILPIKECESIMISKYPVANKEYIFDIEEKEVDNKIDFIKNFRNIKAENNISKDAKVMINTDDEIIIKMLKLTDNIITEPLDVNSYQVSSGDIKATIYFEKVITEEEIALKNKNIENLKNSIARRKKLLANENYVNKAPASLVESEKAKLLEEEKNLEELLK